MVRVDLKNKELTQLNSTQLFSLFLFLGTSVLFLFDSREQP